MHARVGANFTFGHRAAGNVETLREVGGHCGITADGSSCSTIDGRVVSSSSIREALAAGDLAWPRTGLGRRYAVDGRWCRGAGRGKGLGYPTANLRTWPRLLLPGQGIYAGVAELEDGSRYVAAIDVGTNPTFGRSRSTSRRSSWTSPTMSFAATRSPSSSGNGSATR